MRQTTGSFRGRLAALALAAGVSGFLVPGEGAASPAHDPFPIPLYSFDNESPSVTGGDVSADGVLALENFLAAVLYPGANLGFGQPGDDLNAMSFNRSQGQRNSAFVLVFSVDRGSASDVLPDDPFLRGELPFNAADQIARGQAAGDAYSSLTAFNRDGIIPTFARGRGSSANNTQVLNNYDEGGSDFGAKPELSSRDHNTIRAAQDNVDAFARLPSDGSGSGGGRGTQMGPGLYYSAATGSPSLLGSPADILFDPDPMDPAAPEWLFASHSELGLFSDDDIDALIVFDVDSNGVFNLPDDLVLFSLTPGSPSLQIIPDASSNGAADVFMARADSSLVELFASAAQLGLAARQDNVDALELAICSNGLGCGVSWGIRLVKGDWDNDGIVSGVDFPSLATNCMTGPWQGAGFVPPSPESLCLDVFDFDFDGDVDLRDFAAFQEAFSKLAVGQGACCGPPGTSCSDGTLADCISIGGIYQGDGTTCASTNCPSVRYANESYFGDLQPGAGVEVADDMTLEGVGACELIYFDLQVAGLGSAPFGATASLYTDCPGSGGTPIAGTAAQWNGIPSDGSDYILSIDVLPVTIPNTVWMVVSFDDASAAWALAGEAELGYTADVFGQDDPPMWGCDYSFAGAPYAGFWAHLVCASGTGFRSGQPEPGTRIVPTGLRLSATGNVRE